MLADFGRLILLILLLPLILILIGPLLIVAALRGHQPLGPITLDTARYKAAGRTGAFVLGLVLWLLVWGGLAWFTAYSFLWPAGVTWLPSNTGTGEVSQASAWPATSTPTSTARPPTFTARATVPVEAASPEPAGPTPIEPTATALPNPTPLPPDSTATSTATLSPKTPVATAARGLTPAVTETVATVEAAASPEGGLSLAEREAVITVVEEGNVLLREAIREATEENLEAMETVWRGLGLQVAQNFATGVYEQYSKPVEVQFEYIRPPALDPDSGPDEVVLTSREKWRYGGPTKIDHEEVFEFIYTLNREDGQWVISRYTYRNLPAPTATFSSDSQ